MYEILDKGYIIWWQNCSGSSTINTNLPWIDICTISLLTNFLFCQFKENFSWCLWSLCRKKSCSFSWRRRAVAHPGRLLSAHGGESCGRGHRQGQLHRMPVPRMAISRRRWKMHSHSLLWDQAQWVATIFRDGTRDSDNVWLEYGGFRLPPAPHWLHPTPHKWRRFFAF